MSYEITLLLLYLPEKEESNISKSEKNLLTNSTDIFGESESEIIEILDSEPKVIKILDSKPKVIAISDTDTVLADIGKDTNIIEEDKLGIHTLTDSNKLLICSDYSCACFCSSIKISCVEIVLVSKIVILDNIRILYYPNIWIIDSTVTLYDIVYE